MKKIPISVWISIISLAASFVGFLIGIAYQQGCRSSSVENVIYAQHRMEEKLDGMDKRIDGIERGVSSIEGFLMKKSANPVAFATDRNIMKE